MLTKLIVRNFKRFQEVEIELDSPVVFIGPNNSGKTTAMQALALWDLGRQRWQEKFRGRTVPKQRAGVAINRRDLLAAPVPRARELWRDLHIRDAGNARPSGRQPNIFIEITVEGETHERNWVCGLEFDYANEESFYCRPLRTEAGPMPARMPVPEETAQLRTALLPPMSGLAANEVRLDQGAINVRIGEGRTAEVLRNLCYQIVEHSPKQWNELVDQIRRQFGAEISMPQHIPERGEVTMAYRENGITLDLSAAGRSPQQTLFLLAWIHTNPGALLLLDEPDAHLEFLRQEEVYSLIKGIVGRTSGQLVSRPTRK